MHVKPVQTSATSHFQDTIDNQFCCYFHQKNYCDHNYSLGLLQVTKSQLIICDYYLFHIYQGVMELVFNFVPIQGNTSLKLLKIHFNVLSLKKTIPIPARTMRIQPLWQIALKRYKSEQGFISLQFIGHLAFKGQYLI